MLLSRLRGKYMRISSADFEASKAKSTGSTLCKPILFLIFSLLANVALTWTVYNLLSSRGGVMCEQALYSPAQEAIEPQVVKFKTGFLHDITIYSGDPSPELDQAWVDLYDGWGIFRMSKADAERLPNKTYPWPGDPGYYIGQLSVSHQLHCLNRLRQAMNMDYYKKVLEPEVFEPGGTLEKAHLNHCVEGLRQALMCAADISIIPWSWDDGAQKALPSSQIVHSCRNFDRIRDWAERHRPIIEFDGSVRVEDDITVPVIHHA